MTSGPHGPGSSLRVILCVSLAARQCNEIELELPAGSTLLDAIRASGALAGLDAAWVDSLETGIWGRKQSPGQVLQDGDRVELYRPLKVDPKVARRERFSRQGAGTTGLFSKRRAGAKSGY